LTIFHPKGKILPMSERTSNEAVSFETVQAEIQREYQAGNYAAALDLAERYANDFQDQAALFAYWLICFEARLGSNDRSMNHLRRALDRGLWFGDVLLRRSPALQPLQDLEEFEQLVARNRQARQEDESTHYPMIVLHSPGRCVSSASQAEPGCPLLIGLHSNAAAVVASLPFWRPAANAGWLVAAPQSSQAVWKGSYVWDDPEITREEVQHHYRNLISGYSVDPGRVVLAGHSMGGEAAIWLALSGAIPAAGFIAFGPGGPRMDNPDNWLPLIAAASAAVDVRAPGALHATENRANGTPSLRGYLIYGQEDRSIPQRNVHSLAEALEAAGFLCKVEAIPSVGHDFDSQYEAALLRGLSFISP
jgi:predicted esterase